MDFVIFTVITFFEFGIIILLTSFVLFLIKRRNDLLEERNDYRQKFDNATNEVTRLSVLLLKMRRSERLSDNTPIVLDMDKILDKINNIGYVNLTKQEKDFLNKQK